MTNSGAAAPVFNDYGTFLRNRFGTGIRKISVDAGYSCPNRDGSLGAKGCAYCRVDSFVPSYCAPDAGIERQICEGKRFFSGKYPDMKYLVYFQAYSTAYGDPGLLEEQCRIALTDPDVVGLVLATRPDTVGREFLDSVRSLGSDTFMAVELGIESLSDQALIRAGRGHAVRQTALAIENLLRLPLHLSGHFIFGLPGDAIDDPVHIAAAISELGLHSVKFHHLQILDGTPMRTDWERHPQDYPLTSLDAYMDFAVALLENLDPVLIIERFVNEAPAGMVLSPAWGNVKNYVFADALRKRMRAGNTRQGKSFVR